VNNDATNQNNIVIALRTHLWDADIAALAAKLERASPKAEFVILADESRQVLSTGGFTKISHNSDYAHLSLPNFPQRQVLWYNADYPLYSLRAARPHAAYYAMVEYDVAVNVDLTTIIAAVQNRHLDLVTCALKPAGPDWYWTVTGTAFFPIIWQSFLPVIIVSARAIDHMRKRRQEIWQNRVLQIFEDWPFCEVFIPSAISELGPDNMAALADFADLSRFTLQHLLHVNEPAANEPGTMCHRVHGGSLFAMRRLVHEPVLSVFDPGSELRRLLGFCQPADFMPVLIRQFNKLNDFDASRRFAELAASSGWQATPRLWNIAYGKLALQSSTNSDSKFADAAEEARGGNNGDVSPKFNFHTASEADPWWQVDLQALHLIHQVAVYNRLDLPERCVNMTLSVSANGQGWQLAAAKLDGQIFGGADGRPHIWHFTTPLCARFARITLIGETYLHLNQIEIFGEPA
jgi:hypothetical protein